MVNTQYEEAIEKLLEDKGYIIYETDVYENIIIIEGNSDEPNFYDFKIELPNPIVRQEGKSALDIIIEKLNSHIKNIKDIAEGLVEKKEIKSKKYSNNTLTKIFEDAIIDGKKSLLYSSIIGRGTGKTSTIVYLAQKYNIPIVVTRKHYRHLIQRNSDSLEVYDISNNGLVGMNSKIVLIDEFEERYLHYLESLGYIVIGLVKD